MVPVAETKDGKETEAKQEQPKPPPPRPELATWPYQWIPPPKEDEEVFRAWVGGENNHAILKLPLRGGVPSDGFHTELYDGWHPTSAEHDAFTKFYYEQKGALPAEEFKTIFPVTKEWFAEFRKRGMEEFEKDLAEWDAKFGPNGSGESREAVGVAG